jgi:hypothetical protein
MLESLQFDYGAPHFEVNETSKEDGDTHRPSQKPRASFIPDEVFDFEEEDLTFSSGICGNKTGDSTADGEVDDMIALFDDDFRLDTEGLPKQVDSITAQEMTQLSMEDREKVYYDLHGVSQQVSETPEFVGDSLLQLQQKLDAVMEDDRMDAYRKALVMNQEYVQNPKFMLSFLRADGFDVDAAAQRLGKYFAMKLELFGPELLTRRIVQDDLDEDDLEALYHGDMTHVLPFRDRAGRAIYFQHSLPWIDPTPLRAKQRRGFYIVMATSEDEETQKAGTILISYLVGVDLTLQQLSQRITQSVSRAKILAACPVRVEGIHLCYNSIMWKPLLAAFKLHSLMFNRVRTREHFGEAKDVVFSLQTFGIPTTLAQGFPVTSEGDILKHLHVQRWEKRRKWEQLQLQSSVQAVAELVNSTDGTLSTVTRQAPAVRVGTPGPKDVLLGRGKACYLHVGNVRMRNIVLERGHLYDETRLADKHKVVKDLVNLVKEGSGRFLKEDSASWVEVDHEAAEKTVSAALRTLRGIRNAAASDEDRTSSRRSPISKKKRG